MTLGSFDLLHPGHLKLLRVTNRLSGGKPAIVGVNSDRWMREFKYAPTQTEKVRMEMMRGLGLYATVLLNDGPGRKLIKKHKPTLSGDRFGLVRPVPRADPVQPGRPGAMGRDNHLGR